MIDLHLHTTISDSTWNPAIVVKQAAQKNLSAIAITDHERVEGISAAKEAAGAYDIEIVPGIEFFAMDKGYERHILGYFIDYKNPQFIKRLNALEEYRNNQTQLMLDCLKDSKDIDIKLETLFSYAPHGFVGRAHIALALKAVGAVNITQDAFTPEFIGNGGKCYQPYTEMTPVDVIKLIREFDGIPVLAHPGYYGEFDITDDEILALKKQGLMGVECRHMRHTPEMSEHLESFCDKNNLLKTGGSDCHGDIYNPPTIGSVEVPDQWLELIKNSR